MGQWCSEIQGASSLEDVLVLVVKGKGTHQHVTNGWFLLSKGEGV